MEHKSPKGRYFPMKKLLCCLAALLLLTTSAMADMTVLDLKNSPSLSLATGCYWLRVNGGEQLFDAQGNALSAVYSSMPTFQRYGLYYVYSGSGLNHMGLLDAQGQVLCRPTYGHIAFLDDNWALAYVLEPTDAETGDFRNSNNDNKYMAVRTDVLYQGHVIGSLTREEYDPAWSKGVTANYLYLWKSADEGMFIAPDFSITKITSNFFPSEFRVSEKGILYNPTQQMAFCAGCTLTPDDVDTWVWHDSSTDCLLDLQGNVIKSGVMYDYVSQQGDYLLIRHNGLCGIMDLNGNVIVEPIYGDISYSDGLFCNGYQCVLTEKGCLQYLDTHGSVVAGVDYELESNDYKGYSYNAPFAVVNNMGKYIVITRECGELPTRYENFSTPEAYQNILLVQKDGLWGAIDLWGSTVIPFVNTYLTLSKDGTVACGPDENGTYHIYLIAEDEPEDTAPVTEDTTPVTEDTAPAADGSWTCTCGSVNTSKFCPECGTPKPAEPVTPTCSNCGYQPEGETPNFCPECGTKF